MSKILQGLKTARSEDGTEDFIKFKECAFALPQTAKKERAYVKSASFNIPPNRTVCVALPDMDSDTPTYTVVCEDQQGSLVHCLSGEPDKYSVVIDNYTSYTRKVWVAYMRQE